MSSHLTFSGALIIGALSYQFLSTILHYQCLCLVSMGIDHSNPYIISSSTVLCDDVGERAWKYPWLVLDILLSFNEFEVYN